MASPIEYNSDHYLTIFYRRPRRDLDDEEIIDAPAISQESHEPDGLDNAAIASLSQVFSLDSDNYRKRTSADSDFGPIRNEPRFQALISSQSD